MSRPFNIIDKNPRKPRKEGPKAQQAYVEELGSEWIDGHKLNEVEDPRFRDREPEVPGHIRERAERLEAETAEKMRRANISTNPRQRALATDVRAQQKLNEDNRPQVIKLIIQQDMRMYGGMIRQHVIDEARDLGILADKNCACGKPLGFDADGERMHISDMHAAECNA